MQIAGPFAVDAKRGFDGDGNRDRRPVLVCDDQNNYYGGHEKVGCHEKRHRPMMWAL